MANYELDVKRLLCPMPVIKTQQYVKKMAPGDTLTIIATDPGALHDVPAWARMFGHKIINTKQTDLEIIIQLQVQAE